MALRWRGALLFCQASFEEPFFLTESLSSEKNKKGNFNAMYDLMANCRTEIYYRKKHVWPADDVLRTMTTRPRVIIEVVLIR